MTFEFSKQGLGLATPTISGAPRGASPTPASINASADRAINREMRDGHFAAALEQAGTLMLLIMVWVGLHALKWAGKPF